MNKKKSYKSALKYAQELNDKKVDIVEDLYDWRMVGLSLSNSFGEDGRSLFHMVTSANAEDYDQEETDQMFSECLESNKRRDPDLPRVTVASFVRMARHGLKESERIDPNNGGGDELYDGD
ncbi:MAG: PriCT-2 domain-containing protein [Cyclobacteriaceae bacterium]|nr:PriCT-2 domain-containing protein [Cyclobacteriaceae bacterium]